MLNVARRIEGADRKSGKSRGRGGRTQTGEKNDSGLASKRIPRERLKTS